MPGHAAYDPQLAVLVEQAPEGDAWLHEIKYDGYRIVCRVAHGSVELLTRNGNDWSARFAEIAAAVRACGIEEAVLDGEVAIVLPDGRTSFQALQEAVGGAPRSGLMYFVFDLLRYDGESLVEQPLEERKRR